MMDKYSDKYTTAALLHFTTVGLQVLVTGAASGVGRELAKVGHARMHSIHPKVLVLLRHKHTCNGCHLACRNWQGKAVAWSQIRVSAPSRVDVICPARFSKSIALAYHCILTHVRLLCARH